VSFQAHSRTRSRGHEEQGRRRTAPSAPHRCRQQARACNRTQWYRGVAGIPGQARGRGARRRCDLSSWPGRERGREQRHDEVVNSVIMSTPSTSYQRRAIAVARSGLFWWSARAHLDLWPSTSPPNPPPALWGGFTTTARVIRIDAGMVVENTALEHPVPRRRRQTKNAECCGRKESRIIRFPRSFCFRLSAQQYFYNPAAAHLFRSAIVWGKTAVASFRGDCDGIGTTCAVTHYENLEIPHGQVADCGLVLTNHPGMTIAVGEIPCQTATGFCAGVVREVGTHPCRRSGEDSPNKGDP